MARSARWMPVAATVAVAAVLAGAAAVTADRAGCDDPGSWVVRGGDVDLVGGCLDSADLPVAPPPAGPAPDAPAVVPLND
ncbi:MAG: hypothetical protein M3408_02145 [Actinomycetota bacterium]|jgi:hypothetical protein|nr:hypothetical protein [Actinomycetota bacterium]